MGHILNGRHLEVHPQGNLLYQIKILIAKYGDNLKVILSGQEIQEKIVMLWILH